MGLINALFSRTGPGKYMAAKNALIAKYTFASLGQDDKQEVNDKILDLLANGGIPVSDVADFKKGLRETQFHGMAAIAMANLKIKPGLSGILFRDWWENVQNPLVALTGAEKEIEMASDEILRKHRIKISISDADIETAKSNQVEARMGLFDSFTSKKKPGTVNKSIEDQIPEIVQCYHEFYTDIAKPLKESKGKEQYARLIGSEIPFIASYDLQNFNTLLFNNMGLELKEKGSTFLQEQSTFYILFADRYLFSKLGHEGRDVCMAALENGYLNGMMNRLNHNEKAWHYFRQILVEREKECLQCQSIAHLQTFYQAELIQRIGLQDNYALVRILLDQIINTGTTMFAINMLNSLDD